MIQLVAFRAPDGTEPQQLPASAAYPLPLVIVAAPAGGTTPNSLRTQPIAFQAPADALTGPVPVSAANPLPIANIT